MNNIHYTSYNPRKFNIRKLLMHRLMATYNPYTVFPVNNSIHQEKIMCGSRKFCQRGSNFDNFFSFFLVDEGWDDPNTTISGPSSAHQRNGSVALLFLRDLDQIAKRPYIFVIFQGGGGSGPPVPPPWIRT